jgi:hypothetical protein
MTGSLSKKLLWIKGLGLVVVMGAQAYAAEPQKLPQSADGVETRILQPAAGDRGGSPVEIEELAAPDPNAAGALPPGMRPLGPGMWKTLSADELNEKLNRLPAFERSAVMQTLTKRMLLSPSAGPKDGKRDGVADWYVARLRALNARGAWDAALALAEFGPSADPVVAGEAFAARLAARPADETCIGLQEFEAQPEGLFWAQLRVYCQLASGDQAGAQLALDVLREKGASDPSFEAAAAKLLDAKSPAAVPPPSTAIQAAIWRLAAMPVGLQAAKSDAPEIANLAAETGGDDLTRLAGLGALARADLDRMPQWISAVAQRPATPDQKDDPEETAKKLPVAAGDAVFVQTVFARTLPAAKASAFAAMLQRGQARGEFPYTAKLLARAALEIPPLPETAWAAPEATRVLIYNGEVARAESWFKALSVGSPSDQPTINAVQIYGAIQKPSPDPARAAELDKALDWLVRTAAQPGPNQTVARNRIAREFPLLAALGKVLPPEGLEAATDGNSPGVALDIDGPALLDGMARAAELGAAGEAILNASLLLKGQGAAAARSQTVAAIVRALMKLGLRQEAKALALEAMLGQGQRGL